MSKKITITIDGKEYSAKEGQTIVEAAKDNNIFIPTLCHYEGLKPAATCRICTVLVNGRPNTACTMLVSDGMNIISNTKELNDMRKAIIEMLFVEGNHFCPSCEKSGNCELQAFGYKYQMMVPRYPYNFPMKEIDASYPEILIDRNRCILCKRCVRGIMTKDGKSIFTLIKRGNKSSICVDKELAAKMTEEEAEKAMELCPVGAIIKKEKGFSTPIGKRRFDSAPIGSDIEKK